MNLERLRVQVRMNFPWYGVLANLLDWQIDDSVGTACTNGRYIKFAEPFMHSLTEKEQLFVVLHELTHIALKHHLRRGNREHGRFNIAADHRINLQLKRTHGIKMPACGCADPQYIGLTEYEIYEQLGQQPKDEPEQSPSGAAGDDQDEQSESDESEGESGIPDESDASPTGMGDVVDGDDGSLTATELKELEQAVDQAVQLADQLATMAGKGDSGLSEIARSAREPRINWRQPLRRFITNEFPSFRSWRKPDRRWLAAGVVWPGVENQNQAELVFAVDCSDSMSREMVARLSQEVESAFLQVDLATVHIIYFSNEVHVHETYRRGQRFQEARRFPTGGTCFNSLFQYIGERCPNAKAAIVMTDGYDEFPAMPKIKTLWAMTTGIVPPFGEIVKVD